VKIQKIQQQLDQLYKNYDPTDVKHDDKALLRTESKSFKMKNLHSTSFFKNKHKSGLKKKFDDPKYRAKRSVSASRAQTKRFDNMLAEDRKKSVVGLHKAYEEKKDSIVQKLKENWQDPEFRNKQTKNLNEKRGKEWLKNVKEAVKKRANNKEWLSNVQDAHRVYILTPNGVFDSITSAHISHKMSRAWLYQRFKDNPQSFYRINKKF